MQNINMILLDHLTKIENMDSVLEQSAYMYTLHTDNSVAIKYINLCYDTTMRCIYETQPVPKYKTDNVPHGYNFSNLERVFNQFKRFVFRNDGDELGYNSEVYTMKFVQIMESISDIEQRFLRQVMARYIPYFTTDDHRISTRIKKDSILEYPLT